MVSSKARYKDIFIELNKAWISEMFVIVGTREGTVLSALFTGVFVKFFSGKLRRSLQKILSD